jgi:hypothetical protein
MMTKVLLLMLISAASTFGQETVENKPKSQKIVTAAQVNGVYRYYQSEFRILALGHNKLKVQFDGVYITASRTPNLGTATGEAVIDGNVATFKPEDTQHARSPSCSYQIS